MAVANSGSAIAGHVAAHQSTAHEGRASVASVLHARRTLAAIKGAAAAVSLLLALVTTSNDEHGTTIQSTQADSTDGNTGGGGLLLRGLAIGAAGAKGVVVAGARGRTVTTVAAAAAIAAVGRTTAGDLAKDVNLGVDQGGKVAHNGVGVVVDERVGHRHVQLKLVNQVLGVVDLGKSGNVTPLSSGVIRNKLGNLDLLHIDASSVGQSLGKVLEDLSGSNGVAGNEQVVKRIQESNLDRDSAFSSGGVGIIGVDDLGNISWQCCRGRGSLRGSNRGEHHCGRLNDDGCWQPVGGVRQGGSRSNARDGFSG